MTLQNLCMTTGSAMSPLVTQYDNDVQRLKTQIASFQDKIQQLTDENNRLNERLKDEARYRLQGDVLHDAGAAADDDGVRSNLQQQLTFAIHEKDCTVEMLHESQREVERLEKQIQNSRVNPRVQSLEMQAQQIKDQYMRTVSELNQQNTELQDELKTVKNELRVANMQVDDLKKLLEELRSEMLLKEQRRVIDEGSRSFADKRLKQLDQQSATLQSQLAARSVEIDQLRAEKSALEQHLAEQQSKAAEDESRNADAIAKMKNGFQLAENAVIERDQAVVKQRQAVDELTRLQDALTKVVNEAGARTRQEVDIVKKQCNTNLMKLTDELQRLELVCLLIGCSSSSSSSSKNTHTPV